MTAVRASPQQRAGRDRIWRREKQVRRWTRWFRILPSFIIIGAMRCGTTSLYAYLCEHPQVLPAAKKEVRFFDRRFQRGLGWYRSRFPLLTTKSWRSVRCHRPAITGEASPYYLYHPQIAGRIAATLPDVKLIVLLRNPADRAYSHYQLTVRSDREPLSFQEAIRKQDQRLRRSRERANGDDPYRSRAYRLYSYVDRGIYVDQLRAYDAFLAKQQMLVLKSEDLFEKTQETYDVVLRFLGLSPWKLRSIEPRHAGSYSREKPPGYDELREFYAPHNQRLYEYLGRDLGW